MSDYPTVRRQPPTLISFPSRPAPRERNHTPERVTQDLCEVQAALRPRTLDPNELRRLAIRLCGCAFVTGILTDTVEGDPLPDACHDLENALFALANAVDREQADTFVRRQDAQTALVAVTTLWLDWRQEAGAQREAA